MATLRLLEGSGDEFPLEGEFTIGRSPNNGLALTDDIAVSRQHAKVVQANGVYTLTDLGSGNGTHVERDGRRWQVAPDITLRDGDVVLIGKARLVFEAGTATQMGMNSAAATIVGQVVPPRRSDG